ncbi:MAG TPA: hypothetical protein VL424_07755 [Pararobbsia sp.]|nr:hypothetical protein [Pararobbsia sp.]
MRKWVFAAAAGLMCAAGTVAHAHEIYGGLGTDGIGVGYAYSFTSFANVRGEFDGFSLSHSFTSGDINYDAKLNLYHGGLFVDLFPAPSVVPFRFTAGVLIGGDNIDANANAISGTYTFNGTTVSANGETIHAKATFPTLRPYVGIGFGHGPLSKGWGAFFDAGVAYGRPHLDYDVPANIVAAAGQDNVNAEEANLQDKVDRLRFYPIVKVGVTYRF